MNDIPRISRLAIAPAPKVYSQTCGSCKHAKDMLPGSKSDLPNARLCKRLPPIVTILLVPAGGGRAQTVQQTAWPTIDTSWEACGEYSKKILTALDADASFHPN